MGDRDKALEFGAHEFVDLDHDALEDIGGVDLVFDVIGGDIQRRSAGLIRTGGTLVSVVGPADRASTSIGLRSRTSCGYLGPQVTTAEVGMGANVERVQLGVRMEKRIVQVLKGLAEFESITLAELLEKIVLHSFDPVPGDEGEACASPHSRRELEAIARLREVYGLDYDVHATRAFTSPAPTAGAEVDQHT